MVPDDLLQHPPVGTRLVLGDAAAALEVELVHLLRMDGGEGKMAASVDAGRARVREAPHCIPCDNSKRVGPGRLWKEGVREEFG